MMGLMAPRTSYVPMLDSGFINSGWVGVAT
jgi:hypothetical protein